MDAQIPGTRWPGGLNFVLRRQISAGSQYVTCFMTPEFLENS